ncbi:MAG: competence/damage-inducible protein A, partial [Candidatus Atribacteria bacterium]|nr:competence/damage-inducible protein A [Candidatus Atribacteria bacterium]
LSILKEAYHRSQVIITTGGLGPTEDDITFQSIAKSLHLNLVKYPEAEEHMKSILNRANINMSQSNLKQAYLPEGSLCIINEYGTAPAIILEKGNRIIISLPGVPLEMKNLMVDKIIPFLIQRFPSLQHREFKIIRTSGLGESTVNEKIKDFIQQNKQLNIGIYASPEDIQIQLNAIANTPQETIEILQNSTEQLTHILGNYIFGFDNQSLEEVVGNMLRSNHLTLAVAESCTGGMLGEIITSVAGSSDYFKGGIISYDGEIKEKLLGVPQEMMMQYGQVSEQVASEMARSVRKKCNSNIGLSITGIAGPGGGSQEKPVGLVYIALADEQQAIFQKHQLFRDRQTIRLRSARRALNMLRLHLINIETTKS